MATANENTQIPIVDVTAIFLLCSPLENGYLKTMYLSTVTARMNMVDASLEIVTMTPAASQNLLWVHIW